MVTVYLVDGITHVHLPPSVWGNAVRDRLSEMGHSVQPTDLYWLTHHRGDTEMLRVDQLLDSTGL